MVSKITDQYDHQRNKRVRDFIAWINQRPRPWQHLWAATKETTDVNLLRWIWITKMNYKKKKKEKSSEQSRYQRKIIPIYGIQAIKTKHLFKADKCSHTFYYYVCVRRLRRHTTPIWYVQPGNVGQLIVLRQQISIPIITTTSNWVEDVMSYSSVSLLFHFLFDFFVRVKRQ